MVFIPFLLLVVPPVYLIVFYNNRVSTVTWKETITGEVG
jgi:hypothetical protein